MVDVDAQAPVFETLFRHQAAKLVAALLRVLGVARIDAAEDIVQDTLVAALQSWQSGLPRNPSAWLFAVARNRALDLLRRERVRGHGADSAALLDELAATAWPEIVSLYELLYARKRTPVIALNLAIARSMVSGARGGIAEILAIDGREKLAGYPFYWAALVDLALREGDREAAASWIRVGVAASRNEAERAMFRRRAGE
jgi:RNA polymerase sigma-70 factor (ECF subfamily)